MFRLEWIVLVFRGVWAQKVDVQHLIYWQGQCVCNACVLSTQITWESSYPTRKSFFQIFWEYIRTLRQCAGENWLPTWHHSPPTNFYPRKIICTFPLQIYHLLWTTHYLPSGEHNWIFPKHSTATQCCIRWGVVMLGCKFWWNQGSSFCFPPWILVMINCKNIHSN